MKANTAPANIGKAVQTISRHLENIYGCREAMALAKRILSHLTGLDGSTLVIRKDMPLSPDHWNEALGITARLRKQEPIQYILGYTWFYSMKISVSRGVLIPRPETEEMVDRIIHRHNGKIRILDLCTGSGCIALALAKNLPEADITGTDVSEKALKTARLNARKHKLPVKFVQDDLLQPSAAFEKCFDLITCNPPYIRESEKEQMKPNVTEWEPGEALFVPKDDPLLYYRALLLFAGRALAESGSVHMEINETCGEQSANLFAKAGYTVKIHQDIHGKNRFIEAQKKA